MTSATASQNPAALSSGSRIRELDGVRGIAALLVVYQHLFLTFIPAAPKWLFWIRTASGMAWTGVHLFFALSGFLIGSILMENRTAANYFAVFYSRRGLRILPLYFLLIVAFFSLRALSPTAAAAAGTSLVAPWQYFALVQNFPMAVTGTWGFSPLNITWSVAIEEQFYLFLPLIIWIVPERRQLACFVALAACGPLFRAVLTVAYAPFLMPGALDSLLLGTIIAWTWKHHPRFFHGRRFLSVCLATFALAGLAIALIAAKRDFGPFRETLIALFWGSFLAMTIANLRHPFTALFRWPPLVHVGRISYGIYLLHPITGFIVGLVAVNWLGAPDAHALWLSGTSLVLVLLLAHALFRYFESPLIAIGRRLHYAPARTEPVSGGKTELA